MQLQLFECATKKYLEDSKALSRKLSQGLYEARLANGDLTKSLRVVKVRVYALWVCAAHHPRGGV
jgi:hypothetical protein